MVSAEIIDKSVKSGNMWYVWLLLAFTSTVLTTNVNDLSAGELGSWTEKLFPVSAFGFVSRMSHVPMYVYL